MGDNLRDWPREAGESPECGISTDLHRRYFTPHNGQIQPVGPVIGSNLKRLPVDRDNPDGKTGGEGEICGVLDGEAYIERLVDDRFFRL